MSRLPAIISSLFIRDEEKAPVRAVEGYLRAVGRHSAPWPSVACPLECESSMPAPIRVTPSSNVRAFARGTRAD
jgi:hypothetical protein